MNWTTAEIRYLEEHANEGAEAIASHLGRSRRSVETQAQRYGISLRKLWMCPKCGRRSSRPLSSRTGWCPVCTKAQRRERMAEEVRELEEEARREEEEDRARQCLYSRKNRARKKIEKVRKRRV